VRSFKSTTKQAVGILLLITVVFTVNADGNISEDFSGNTSGFAWTSNDQWSLGENPDFYGLDSEVLYFSGNGTSIVSTNGWLGENSNQGYSDFIARIQVNNETPSYNSVNPYFGLSMVTDSFDVQFDFIIDKQGYYLVGRRDLNQITGGSASVLADWTQSTSTTGDAILKITRQGNTFRFFVDLALVETIEITDVNKVFFSLYASNIGDGYFDNFMVTDLSEPTNQSPTASFSLLPLSGDSPFTASPNGYTSSDPDGSISSYSWSTSDGQSSTSPIPSFTVTIQGSFP